MRQLKGLSPDGETITLKLFHGLSWKNGPSYENAAKAIYLDVETTGTDRLRDKVIDLAYVLFTYDKREGRPLSVVKTYQALNDPGEPLSDEITKLTGITDEMVKGQSINWQDVEEDFASVPFIMSHNASFDRAFIDRMVPLSKEKFWGCSLTQVPWRDKGHASASLECLCKDHGFFFKGHRALADVEAALELISFVDPLTGHPYLHELLEKARTKMKWVYADKATFDFKDFLKARGYQWDAAQKVWKILVHHENQEEKAFIEQHSPLAGLYREEEVPLNQMFRMD